MTNTQHPGTDTVYVIRIDGTRFGPFATQLDCTEEPSKALIYEVTLNAGGGDTLEWHKAEGGVEKFDIITTHFQPQMRDVKAHYTLRLRARG
ncbi:hypothetical protein [Pseudomonas sp. nanlin1]|uniref:hypothetical protein n=1 Tax=Pseudomonas sp. nanlin1 TaxID=3040605 RepID=UPI0038903174